MSPTRWHAAAMLVVACSVLGLQVVAWNASRNGGPEADRAKLQIAGLPQLVLGVALHWPPPKVAGAIAVWLQIAFAFAIGIVVGARSPALQKPSN